MKYRRYAAYKESGVEWLGEVPAHWTIRRLRHISPQMSVGVVVNPSTYVTDEGVPFLYGSNVSEGRISTEACRRISAEVSSGELAKSLLHANDLVTVRVGYPGVTAVVPPELEGANCASMMIVRKSANFSSNWLCYAMNSRIGRQQVEVVQYGAAQEQFNISHAVDFTFPYPPIEDQYAIAVFLDRETTHIDALIAKQERLIAVLQEKRQALISHAVTKGLNPDAPMKDSGVEWLGEVPAHWEVKRLKSLVTDSAAGPYGSSLTKAMYTQEGYRVYGQQQVISDDFEVGDYYISESQYQQMFQYRVLPGDVLVSVVGTTGRVAVVPDNVAPGIINPRLVRYRPDFSLVRSRYLQAALRSQASQAQMSQHATGSTMDVLNMEILGSVYLAIPPLPEQDMILDWLRDETERIFTTVVATELGVELLHERRSALISAAVTGKIDVRS